FNDIAILNRLQVSYWVSMTANESLISWTSYARAMWIVSYKNLLSIGGSWDLTQPVVTDCDHVQRDAKLAADRVRNIDFGPAWAGWDTADANAGRETMAIQVRIAALRAETRGPP